MIYKQRHFVAKQSYCQCSCAKINKQLSFGHNSVRTFQSFLHNTYIHKPCCQFPFRNSRHFFLFLASCLLLFSRILTTLLLYAFLGRLLRFFQILLALHIFFTSIFSFILIMCPHYSCFFRSLVSSFLSNIVISSFVCFCVCLSLSFVQSPVFNPCNITGKDAV